MNTTQETVVIPSGTLVHVGGMPFRTIQDTSVAGSEGNLRIGLEALAQPSTEGGGASYTRTVDASAKAGES